MEIKCIGRKSVFKHIGDVVRSQNESSQSKKMNGKSESFIEIYYMKAGQKVNVMLNRSAISYFEEVDEKTVRIYLRDAVKEGRASFDLPDTTYSSFKERF